MKTKHDTDNLDQIAASIVEKHQQFESAAKAAQKSARNAVVLAWEIGDMLLRAKTSHPGGFTEWRKALSGISSATSSRYLALSHRLPQRSDLEAELLKESSLTDLYRELGILPKKAEKPEAEFEPEPEEEDANQSSSSSQSEKKGGGKKITAKAFLSSLTSVAEKTEALRKSVPLAQWTDEEREGFFSSFLALKAIADELGTFESSNRKTLAEEVVSMDTSDQAA